MELVQSFWSIEHFYMFMNNSGLYIEKKEFSENWKNICDEAIEDIPYLTEHIRTYMSKLF